MGVFNNKIEIDKLKTSGGGGGGGLAERVTDLENGLEQTDVEVANLYENRDFLTHETTSTDLSSQLQSGVANQKLTIGETGYYMFMTSNDNNSHTNGIVLKLDNNTIFANYDSNTSGAYTYKTTQWFYLHEGDELTFAVLHYGTRINQIFKSASAPTE